MVQVQMKMNSSLTVRTGESLHLVVMVFNTDLGGGLPDDDDDGVRESEIVRDEESGSMCVVERDELKAVFESAIETQAASTRGKSCHSLLY